MASATARRWARRGAAIGQLEPELRPRRNAQNELGHRAPRAVSARVPASRSPPARGAARPTATAASRRHGRSAPRSGGPSTSTVRVSSPSTIKKPRRRRPARAPPGRPTRLGERRFTRASPSRRARSRLSSSSRSARSGSASTKLMTGPPVVHAKAYRRRRTARPRSDVAARDANAWPAPPFRPNVASHPLQGGHACCGHHRHHPLSSPSRAGRRDPIVRAGHPGASSPSSRAGEAVTLVALEIGDAPLADAGPHIARRGLHGHCAGLDDALRDPSQRRRARGRPVRRRVPRLAAGCRSCCAPARCSGARTAHWPSCARSAACAASSSWPASPSCSPSTRPLRRHSPPLSPPTENSGPPSLEP